ncbi:MAG: Bax inhibitor-1/YccA family protein [Acholeplasmataceae bacterium]|nr:Bax inhibitor-1/YccA family protein [Acholeplasmataceae bacterium]
MRSSNPVFSKIQRDDTYVDAAEATYGGITLKTLVLLLLAVASGFTVVFLAFEGYIGADSFIGLLIGSMIIAFISVMVASFSPRLAMPFSIIYALSEGVLLGFITAIFEAMYAGVAVTAVVATITIFGVMLFLYSSRTIRVTSRFRKIMYTALFSILILAILFGLFSWIAPNLIASVQLNGSIALLITGVLVVFGALMLTLDFDRAESIVEGGASKQYEWVVAIGLMVTIVWIYIELLRFLAILASRRN